MGVCVCSCRWSDVSLVPPNVSLSRKPFIRLQQQLMELDQQEAPAASATNDLTAAVNVDFSDDDASDAQSVSSDRCKYKGTYIPSEKNGARYWIQGRQSKFILWERNFIWRQLT